MEPLITVIVPVYNTSRYLEQCVPSIINQTYSKLEIILVDDGSTDNSGEICDRFREQDPRIRVIHKKNGGLSSARNEALDVAKGNLIGFVDSDDSIDIGMYTAMVREMQAENADAVMCGFAKINPDGSEVDENSFRTKTVFRDGSAFEALAVDDKIGSQPCNKLFKAELFNGIRFPIGRVYEDISIMHKVFFNVKTFVCLPECMYRYQMNPNSISFTQNTVWAYSLFKAFADRYCDVRDMGAHDNTIDICLSKAVGFGISGTIMCLSAKEPQANEKTNEFRHFMREHMKEIQESKTLTAKRKVKALLLAYFFWLFQLLYQRR